MQSDSTLYVGLDVHEDSIMAAYAISLGEMKMLSGIGTTHTAVDRLCKQLQAKAGHVCVVYEARPCGYGLYRQLREWVRSRGVRAFVHPTELKENVARPTGATRSSWRVRCAQAIFQRCMCPAWKAKRSGIWAGCGRPPGRISSRQDGV